MRRVWWTMVPLVLLAASCAAPGNDSAVSTAPAEPTPSLVATPSNTPSAAVPSPFPSTLANGWTYGTFAESTVKKLTNSLNQVFPDADLKGSSYENSDGSDVLTVFIGEGRVDVLSLPMVFGVNSAAKSVRDYTSCAKSSEALLCVTDTAPSVTMYYYNSGDSDGWAFTTASLAELTAETQADL